MSREKKIIFSIAMVILLIVVVTSSTYAFLAATTNDGSTNAGSGMLGINYEPPGDIGGTLIPSLDRSGGLFTSTTASLKTGSQKALFNMYLTPTALTNLNISSFKWETEALRDTNNDGVQDVVCSKNGNFNGATVNTAIKIVDACELTYDATTFNIYIWLDSSTFDSSISGASFGASIGADSVNITGTY